MLWHPHVQTRFYLIGITGLEYRSHHCQRTAFTSLLKVWVVESGQRLSYGNQFVVVGASSIHWYQVAHR